MNTNLLRRGSGAKIVLAVFKDCGRVVTDEEWNPSKGS